VTRVVVFAYSEVGVRCLRELLDQDIRVPLVFTHADDPGESRWFGSVKELADARGVKVVAAHGRTSCSRSTTGIC